MFNKILLGILAVSAVAKVEIARMGNEQVEMMNRAVNKRNMTDFDTFNRLNVPGFEFLTEKGMQEYQKRFGAKSVNASKAAKSVKAVSQDVFDQDDFSLGEVLGNFESNAIEQEIASKVMPQVVDPKATMESLAKVDDTSSTSVEESSDVKHSQTPVSFQDLKEAILAKTGAINGVAKKDAKDAKDVLDEPLYFDAMEKRAQKLASKKSAPNNLFDALSDTFFVNAMEEGAVKAEYAGEGKNDSLEEGGLTDFDMQKDSYADPLAISENLIATLERQYLELPTEYQSSFLQQAYQLTMSTDDLFALLSMIDSFYFAMVQAMFGEYGLFNMYNMIDSLMFGSVFNMPFMGVDMSGMAAMNMGGVNMLNMQMPIVSTVYMSTGY